MPGRGNDCRADRGAPKVFAGGGVDARGAVGAEMHVDAAGFDGRRGRGEAVGFDVFGAVAGRPRV